MRSLKFYGKSMFNSMIENNYYMINNTYVFNYSGLGTYPITNQNMITGKGKIVNIISGCVTICEDPEEKIGIITVDNVNTIQPLLTIDLDELLNNSIYQYDQI
jgi:hypothetical protein